MWFGKIQLRDKLSYRFFFGAARFEEEQNQFLRFLKKRSIEKLFCYFYLDKLIHFFYSKISFLVGNLSSYLLKLQFTDFGLLARYRTVQN